MKKIIAFAGSDSKTSINKQLVEYTSSLVQNVNSEVLDLNDYVLPLYSINYEKEKGIPDIAEIFLDKIKSSDGIILSLAEHNGAYASVFKNLFDWMSRIDGKLWNNVPMLLMATSPGGRGGASVLEIAKGRFPYMGGNIVADFSLPSFNANFSDGKITDEALNSSLISKVNDFQNSI